MISEKSVVKVYTSLSLTRWRDVRDERDTHYQPANTPESGASKMLPIEYSLVSPQLRIIFMHHYYYRTVK